MTSPTNHDLPVNAQDYYEFGRAAERQRLAAKLREWGRGCEGKDLDAYDQLMTAADLIESEDQT